MDRFFRCITKDLLILLVMGGVLFVMNAHPFLVSLKPAISFEDMINGTEIQPGDHVAGNVVYSLDYFASETTYTRYKDGSRSGDHKNGNYYLIPAASGFAGLKCRQVDVSDMNKLTDETFAMLEGGAEPTTQIFLQGEVEVMESDLVKYFNEYLTDMGYTEAEIKTMGEPLVIRYVSFGGVRGMFAVGTLLLILSGVIFVRRFKREGQGF